MKYDNEADAQQALKKDDQVASHLLRKVLNSTTGERQVLELREKRAESFMDVLHQVCLALIRHVLVFDILLLAQGIRQSDDIVFCRAARRLLKKLAAACGAFPPSLFLEGVRLVDDSPIGAGGFADIFRGSHNGQDIVLKRIRVYQSQRSEFNEISKVSNSSRDRCPVLTTTE